MKLVLYSISLKILINIPGPTLSGRYVIVQMDNGLLNGLINLREVMAFGEKGEAPRSELNCCQGFVKNEKKLLFVCGAGVNINVKNNFECSFAFRIRPNLADRPEDISSDISSPIVAIFTKFHNFDHS